MTRTLQEHHIGTEKSNLNIDLVHIIIYITNKCSHFLFTSKKQFLLNQVIIRGKASNNT